MDEQPTTPVKEQTPKQQVVDALKSANNVLVTISNNPSVDQLAACIGLTLMLNKLDKHATAVFSGVVPSTLEFLQPEKTIETNTDSLRDFIISLDKSKADKLRYKVEDEVVRIYITPYRTSITSADLEFTQGNFNVDVVVALGIRAKEELDSAIIEHGQILHDATVIDLSCGADAPAEIGSINWHDASASSLSEMLVSISEAFKTGLLDTQMATAFLTGIVSETDRFSNDKTTPKVMTMSAQLMAAGANQQLIANQLAIQPTPPTEPVADVPMEPLQPVATQDGELTIPKNEEPTAEVNEPIPAPPAQIAQSDPSTLDLHKEEDHSTTSVDDVATSLGASGSDVTQASDSTDSTGEVQPPEIEIDEHGNMVDLSAAEEEKQYAHKQKIIQPLNTAPPMPKTDLSTVDINAVPNPGQVQEGQVTSDSLLLPPEPAVVAPINSEPTGPISDASVVPDIITSEPTPEQTLADLEKAVDSPHIEQADNARDAVADAMSASTTPAPDFNLPAEAPAGDDQNQVAPPVVPPPFVPPYMQPQQNSADELNLPPPQQ